MYPLRLTEKEFPFRGSTLICSEYQHRPVLKKIFLKLNCMIEVTETLLLTKRPHSAGKKHIETGNDNTQKINEKKLAKDNKLAGYYAYLFKNSRECDKGW